MDLCSKLHHCSQRGAGRFCTETGVSSKTVNRKGKRPHSGQASKSQRRCFNLAPVSNCLSAAPRKSCANVHLTATCMAGCVDIIGLAREIPEHANPTAQCGTARVYAQDTDGGR